MATRYVKRRIGILGSGIAGLFTAFELARNEAFGDHEIAVIAQGGFEGAASATPVALLNPATGKTAKLVGGADFLLPFTLERLEEIEQGSGGRFVRRTGVLRPAPDAQTAEAMRGRLQTDPWPPGWACWLGREQVRERFGEVFGDHGALWIPEGASVRMPGLLSAMRGWLAEAGVTFIDAAVVGITGPGELGGIRPIRVRTDSGGQAEEFDRLVVATGHGTPGLRRLEEEGGGPVWEKGLGLHRVKGQMLTVRLRQAPQVECAVSMGGYAAPTGEVGEWVVGSTYEHRFEHEEPDEAGREKLLSVLERMFPGLSAGVVSARGWAGVRTHRPPERQPLLEVHPEIAGVVALTGFGSKGLIQGPYLARNLVSRLAREEAG